MDETDLLRELRADVPPPTDDALSRGRSRLDAALRDAGAASADGEPRAAHGDRTRVHRPRGRTLRLLAGAGVAAALVVAFVATQDRPAEAATALDRASDRLHTTPAPGDGQYRRITTRTEGLDLDVDDDGRIVGAYGDRAVAVTYVPSDVSDAWVQSTWSARPTTIYGGADQRRRADAAYAEAAHADDPSVVRAPGGRFVRELGGDGDAVTAADLADLPRDPERLRDELAGRGGRAQDATERVIDQATSLLDTGLVDAELTSALYRAVALLPDVTIADRQVTLDGREGTAIGVADPDGFSTNELVVDLATGEFLGTRSRLVKASGVLPQGTVVGSSSVSRPTIVDAAP